MSVSSMPWIFAFAVGILSLVLRVQHGFAPLDVHLPPSPTANATAEGLFSDTYYDARGKFRMLAKQIQGLELHTLPLPNYEHLDLTIDIAVLPGSAKHAMVHISGTHGVEGFAGSAIQSAILERKLRYGHDEKNAPTLIMVHALNPYGFARLRRFNENNVDINRNFLTPEEFAHLQKLDPNRQHYEDLRPLFDPDTDIEQVTYSFWYHLGRTLLQYSMATIKAAFVSGTYHDRKGIFYGGDELQPSLILLKQFLKNHVQLDQLKSFACIDVHTGLGAPGKDTLIASGKTSGGRVKEALSEEDKQGRISVIGNAGDALIKEYDIAGDIMTGIFNMLPTSVQSNTVIFAQEFGTVPLPFVFKTIIEENYMYHSKIERRLPYAETLRDAFYINKSPSWKSDIIMRGVSVFERTLKATSPQ